MPTGDAMRRALPCAVGSSPCTRGPRRGMRGLAAGLRDPRPGGERPVAVRSWDLRRLRGPGTRRFPRFVAAWRHPHARGGDMADTFLAMHPRALALVPREGQRGAPTAGRAVFEPDPLVRPPRTRRALGTPRLDESRHAADDRRAKTGGPDARPRAQGHATGRGAVRTAHLAHREGRESAAGRITCTARGSIRIGGHGWRPGA